MDSISQYSTQQQTDRLFINISRSILGLCGILVVFAIVGRGIYITQTNGTQLFWDALIKALISLANGFMAYLILSKYPRHTIGWLLLSMSVVFALDAISYLGSNASLSASSVTLVGILQWLRYWVSLLGQLIPFLILPLYYPTGNLLSLSWRPVVYLTIVNTISIVSSLLLGSEVAAMGGLVNPYPLLETNIASDFLAEIIGPILFFATALANIVAMVRRWKGADTLVRAQLKWFFYPVAIMIAWFPFVAVAFLFDVGDSYDRFVNDILGNLLFRGINIAIPIFIGIAILRHRLFDIDIIIRRTVQYGLVSAVLAAVYFGTITLIQGRLTAVTDTQSPIAIVLSTLLIAALFNPLRQRVQTFIDRRFYRQKYDAQQILADFAQTARDEVEMEALQVELLRVVQETLQPETIAIWVKSTEN